MNTNPESQGRWFTHRGVVVVVVAALVLLGGLASTLPVSAAPGAVRDDPSEPTVAPPTQPATVPPTAAPTAPPQTTAATPATSEAPETSPPASWNQSSSGDASDQWQQPRSSVTGRYSESASDDAAPVATTTPAMTTTQDLLVGPSTTRAAPTTVAPRDVTGSSVTTSGGSSDPKIWAIVAALTLVAVGLGVATVVYWRRTRPAPLADDGDVGGGRRSGPRKRSRYSDLVVSSPEPR